MLVTTASSPLGRAFFAHGAAMLSILCLPPKHEPCFGRGNYRGKGFTETVEFARDTALAVRIMMSRAMRNACSIEDLRVLARARVPKPFYDYVDAVTISQKSSV